MGNWNTGDVITADRLNAMQTAVMAITLREEGSSTPPNIHGRADMSFKDVEELLSENIPIIAIAQMPENASYPAGFSGRYLMTTVTAAYRDNTDKTHPYHVDVVFSSPNLSFKIDLAQSGEGYDQPLNGDAVYG